MTLLDYVLKYANETSKAYAYYGTSLSDRYITISNTGIDELFEILKGKNILCKRDGRDSNLYLIDSKPDIKFNVEELENDEYKIYPNIDIYELIQGKEYTYKLMGNTLYKCSNRFKENELKKSLFRL